MKRMQRWLFIILMVILLIFGWAIAKVIGEGIGGVLVPPVERYTASEQYFLKTLSNTVTEIAPINLKVVNLYSDYASGNTTDLVVRLMSAVYAKQYGDLLTRFSLADAPPGYETLREAVIQNITSRQKQLEVMSEYVKTGDSSHASLIASYEVSIAQSAALMMNEMERLASAKK